MYGPKSLKLLYSNESKHNILSLLGKANKTHYLNINYL